LRVRSELDLGRFDFNLGFAIFIFCLVDATTGRQHQGRHQNHTSPVHSPSFRLRQWQAIPRPDIIEILEVRMNPTTIVATEPVSGAPDVKTSAPAATGRLLSLDAFRGITIAGMLLVINPGSWSHIYPPLEHATWNGWTPTDLIFPFFVFIVGVAM